MIVVNEKGIAQGNPNILPAPEECITLLNLVNGHRAKHNLAAFVWNNDLYTIAYARVQEAALEYSHTRPNKTDWNTIFDEHHMTDYSYVAENLNKINNAANDQDALQRTLDSWVKSEAHNANLLSANTIAAFAVVTRKPPKAPYTSEYIVAGLFMTPKVKK